ncbi:MAG TPA: hypothetical protein ENK65_00505 [Helicobacteraceae bacterium]|nr:hypothetical protein [Helicobacteraceae bacterium]
MIKNTFFSLLLLSSTLFAQDGQWLIGLDVGGTGTNITQNDTSISEDKKALSYGAKVGFQEGSARIFLAYNHADETTATDYTLASDSVYVQLDGFGEDFKVIGNATARFFLGAHVGAYIPDLALTGSENVTSTALMGGAQGGIIFLLPAKLEIELAYRHMWTSLENDITINAGTAYTALNFKF